MCVGALVQPAWASHAPFSTAAAAADEGDDEEYEESEERSAEDEGTFLLLPLQRPLCVCARA